MTITYLRDGTKIVIGRGQAAAWLPGQTRKLTLVCQLDGAGDRISASVNGVKVAEVNRPGESGDSVCWLTGLGEAGVLTVVGGFEFGGWNVAAGLIEPPVVVPVDVVQGGEFDLFGGAPGPAWLDQLSFVQADQRLGEGVVQRRQVLLIPTLGSGLSG